MDSDDEMSGLSSQDDFRGDLDSDGGSLGECIARGLCPSGGGDTRLTNRDKAQLSTTRTSPMLASHKIRRL